MGLGEGGEGGGAGEGVTGDDSISLSDRRRRPGEHHFPLSSYCPLENLMELREK